MLLPGDKVLVKNVKKFQGPGKLRNYYMIKPCKLLLKEKENEREDELRRYEDLPGMF